MINVLILDHSTFIYHCVILAVRIVYCDGYIDLADGTLRAQPL